MDRFVLITSTVTDDGAVNVSRTICSLAAILRHIATYWPGLDQHTIDRGIFPILNSKGVGDVHHGPSYTAGGVRCSDRITYLGCIDAVYEAATISDECPVNRGGHPHNLTYC